MNLKKALKLMDKFAKCPECGNDSVGNGEGILEVTENIFKRTCKCGWYVEINIYEEDR